MLANQDTIKERLDICRSCPYLIPITYTCKKCGCFMKIKTKLETSVCPLDKW
jgi:hypothetical protein